MAELDEITVVQVGIPGPSGSGVSAAEKAAILADIATALASLGVIVQDEGGALTTRGTTLNFVGAGVTASGAGATKTITISGAGAVSIVVQEGDSTVEAAATTLDFDADKFVVAASPAGEANIALRDHHATLVYRGTKSYSGTALSTTDTALLTVTTDVLTSGIQYSFVAIGLAQGGGGAGNAEIGVRIGAAATTWGMQVGTVGGERPMMASASAPITGAGATVSVTLRGRTTTGTGDVQAAHLLVFAIPRS
jgi:hypothetical protein